MLSWSETDQMASHPCRDEFQRFLLEISEMFSMCSWNLHKLDNTKLACLWGVMVRSVCVCLFFCLCIACCLGHWVHPYATQDMVFVFERCCNSMMINMFSWGVFLKALWLLSSPGLNVAREIRDTPSKRTSNICVYNIQKETFIAWKLLFLSSFFSLSLFAP